MAKEEKEKKVVTISSLIKDLSKKYNNDKLILRGDVVPTFKRVPSKAFGFSYVLYGGLPEGTIVEYSGPEHSGKTLCASLAISDIQRKYPDKTVVYIDVEALLDVPFHQKMNDINLEKLYYIKPTMMSGEQIMDMASDFLKLPEVGGVVLDSLPALKPQIVWENDLTKDAGLQATMAKKFHAAFPMMKSIVAENGSILVLVNQTRDKQIQIGGKTVMTQEEACGGAAKFYSDIIIRFGKRTFTKGEEMDYKGSGLEQGEDADGFRLKFKIIKNKTAKVARGGGFITYRYDTGMDYVHDLLEIAVNFKFIKPISDRTYAIVDLDTGEILNDEKGKPLTGYKSKIIEYFNSHPEFCEEYLKKLTKKVSESDESYGMLVDTSDIDAEQANIDKYQGDE